MAIKDALGEDDCPPLPSAQSRDMIQWILHVQSKLTNTVVKGSRNAMQGSGPPPSFIQETKEYPLDNRRAPSPSSRRVPFGIRRMSQLDDMDLKTMDATRDHYGDLLERKNEFREAQPRGIATMRLGGEGRRHLYPEDHMENDGVSNSAPAGIETGRVGGEGRKHLTCKDNLFVQQRELEAWQQGVTPQRLRPKQPLESFRSGGQDMARILSADTPDSPLNQDPIKEPWIGGDRKRHLIPEDHMLNNGTADAVEGSVGHGRKHIDTFAGRTQMSGYQDSYRATWKQDPSRLMGTSLII